MRRRAKASVAEFGMSFLDVICCGFGAIILLLMITKIVEPQIREDARRSLLSQISELRAEIEEVEGNIETEEELLRVLLALDEERKTQRDTFREELDSVFGEYELALQGSKEGGALTESLRIARQKLTEEMLRLRARAQSQVEGGLIAGVPVDSEYIIFIIDTSGSMYGHAWNSVQEKISEILNIHPKVKGIQVLNDMGDYMFGNYSGRWIPDTPGRRRIILSTLRTWSAFSNSSPVEGIQHAIRTFHDNAKSISLYVFGDEFTGPSIEDVIERVDRINRVDESGKRRVRIHAVGFPVQFGWGGGAHLTGIRFASLMRELSHQNQGTFIGLSEFH